MQALVLVLALTTACAGPGKRYPCDPDAGACGGVELPDGGASTSSFISDPFTIWHDGQHNAATDVVRFQGALFAAFRHASGWSADPTAQVYVARSGDKGRTWQQTASLSGGGCDLRQPKLFLFDSKLWVIATAWQTADPTLHRTSVRVSSSEDGIAFIPFADVPGHDGYAAWRPRPIDSLLYFSVWAADELFAMPAPNGFGLLSTTDGAAFAPAGIPPAGAGAREGDLLVRASGERWLAVPERSISGSGDKQTFCHAPAAGGLPAWQCWSVPGLPIESPALFEWKSILFVAGKRDTGGGHKRTSIWQVLEDDHDLSPVADVPSSFGDTGGPGVTQLDADRALLTFHTTSVLDPHLAQLGHEPTEVETQSIAMAADALAVELFMPSAAAGH